MKKLLICLCMIGFVFAAGAMVSAQAPEGAKQKVDELKSLKQEYDKQEKMIGDLKKLLFSGAAAGVVLVIGGIALLSFVVKNVNKKHEEHTHQMIHNYHHSHHDHEFDHDYHSYHERAGDADTSHHHNSEHSHHPHHEHEHHDDHHPHHHSDHHHHSHHDRHSHHRSHDHSPHHASHHETHIRHQAHHSNMMPDDDEKS